MRLIRLDQSESLTRIIRRNLSESWEYVQIDEELFGKVGNDDRENKTMKTLKAFIGHSFNDEDSVVVAGFLKYFESLRDIGLEWDHAEKAEAKELAIKVKEKMEGKILFIGIFTRKNRQIKQSQLTPCFWKKTMIKALEQDYFWTTSDWVVQESGYALAKGMNLILITEQGIEQIGGLQGNLEYVPFNRENISKSFSKLNEMITKLIGEEKYSIQNESKEKVTEEPTTESKEEKSDSAEPSPSTSFSRMIMALRDGDNKSQEKCFEEWLSEKEGEYEKISARSFYLWLQYDHLKKDVLHELLELSKKYPEHPMPYVWLGRLHREYKQHKKAVEYFLSASKYYTETASQTSFVCAASKELTKLGSLDEARKLLMERLRLINSASSDELSEVYKTLSFIENIDNNVVRKLALLEKALALKPLDNTIRFDLAYAYSDNKNNPLALYHYLILSDSNPSSSALNNLGAAYSEAGMEGKSVESYLKSKELGGTTAVGNLANKLIEKGFIQEAKDMLNEAITKPDADSNVSRAMTYIAEVSKNENDKEKELLSKVPKDLDFFTKYAEAYTDISWMGTLAKKWKSIRGTVFISIEQNEFGGTGQFTMPRLPALPSIAETNAYRGFATLASFADTSKELLIKGKKMNRAIDFNLTIRDKVAKGRAIPSAADNLLVHLADYDEKKFVGQMIISSDSMKIEVREVDSKGDAMYYEMIPE